MSSVKSVSRSPVSMLRKKGAEPKETSLWVQEMLYGSAL